MCGIAGLLDYTGSLGRERLYTIAAAMNETITHRGPDDSGVWVDPTNHCALAQRRLSIVDLSVQGHQPMVDEFENAAITFNGEVYNYKNLRQNLISQGYTFKSNCDTEVLLHILRDQKPDHLTTLRGMFGLGVWNTHKQRLFLARDPFGKKPLYIAKGKDWLAFASELRALEVIADLDRTITKDALGDYLLVQYFHAPLTVYRGVEKIPPGCYMTVTTDGEIKSGRYFNFQAGSSVPNITLASTYEKRVEQLGEIIKESVNRRLISDVPLGAFLSGGVDSALIVAMMRRLGVHTKTYSVGFQDSPDSEHVYAREIAEHLGCEHHDILVHPDAIELASMIADSLDEPNGDSSCLPTNLLSEFTRKHVTVALSGDGGDEMFGGYGRYLDVLREYADPGQRQVDNWNTADAYLGPRWTIFQAQQIEAFLGELPMRTRELLARWSAMLDTTHYLGNAGLGKLYHGMRNIDAESYMPGSVLAKVDRMSMQFALEVRCPLLDIDVANYAAALSHEDLLVKASDQTGACKFSGKRILKDILLRDLPREWVDRPKKGFGLPAGFWDGPGLRDFAYDLLDSASTKLRDIFDNQALIKWLESQQDPNFFSIYRLWPMLMLELWLRKPFPTKRYHIQRQVVSVTEMLPDRRSAIPESTSSVP